MLDNTTTVRAETVDKAIEKGLNKLNISRDQAEVHVISEGKKGLFGFGKQDAIVEVTMKNDLSYKEITQQLEEEVRQAQASESPKEIDLDPIDSEEEVMVEEEIIPVDVPLESVEEPEEEEIVESEEYAEPVAAEVKEDQAQEAEESQGLPLEEACQQVARYIEEVIDQYGAHADVEYEFSGNQVIFNIDTDKSGLVIGKHGKIINSMQVISQTLLQNLYRRRVSLILNVGDYRDRRAHVLSQMAQRTADEVLRTKQAVILDPLPAYERKQIHAHLSRIDNVKTHSEGKEPNRYLVVEYINR